MHDGARVLGEDAHLAQVRVARLVALEAVLVAALLLAHLAVPPQLLQAFGFYAVRNRLWRHETMLWHRQMIPPRSSRLGRYDSVWAGVPCVGMPGVRSCWQKRRER